MRSGDLGNTLAFAHATPFDGFLFGRRALSHPRLVENASNSATLNSEVPGQLQNRTTSTISSDYFVYDRVVAFEHEWFTGHVYNLQTESEYYIAQGVVVHNCRCALIEWVGDEEQDALPEFVVLPVQE
jgi:hypothetical protein